MVHSDKAILNSSDQWIQIVLVVLIGVEAKGIHSTLQF